jgi:hypothetical protein
MTSVRNWTGMWPLGRAQGLAQADLAAPLERVWDAGDLWISTAVAGGNSRLTVENTGPVVEGAGLRADIPAVPY